MTAQEVARETGLPVSEARLAKKREFDEPFRVLDSGAAALRSLLAALRRAGLRCIRGGRFHHLTGVADKGLAVKKLKSIYEREWGPVRSMGLGDGLNDAPLLRAVDFPVIVLNPTSGATAQLQRQVPNAILTRAPGPRGWNQAVLSEAGRHSPK